LRIIQGEFVKNRDWSEVVVVLRLAIETLASGASKVASIVLGLLRITR
jgi:hypothetical protein